jgi:hypothetical protein
LDVCVSLLREAEMTEAFTDDDLARLIDEPADRLYRKTFMALVRRLEASEALNQFAGHKDFCGIGDITPYCQCRLPEFSKAWKAARGIE